MTKESESVPGDTPAACPICGGSGEITHIDEEVGCQVTEPCWRCALPPGTPAKPE